MYFSLILFQWKIRQLISQNLVTLKECLLLYTAGCHHHFHFCLLCMGLHNLNEIILRKRRINFCFKYQLSTSVFLLVICCSDSNLFHTEFMLSCGKISLLMFLRHIFSKALRGSERAPLLRFDGISCGSLKFLSSCTDLWHVLRKESDWLIRPECYAQVLGYLLLKQSNSFGFLRQNSQTFLASYIVPDLFKWTLL